MIDEIYRELLHIVNNRLTVWLGILDMHEKCGYDRFDQTFNLNAVIRMEELTERLEDSEIKSGLKQVLSDLRSLISTRLNQLDVGALKEGVIMLLNLHDLLTSVLNISALYDKTSHIRNLLGEVV